MTNHCGTCTACCRVFTVAEIKKPATKWCDHCTVGKGCNIYETRPRTCVEFECIWLQSQSQPGCELPLAMRPDKSKVVFTPATDLRIMTATTMPNAPLAWMRPDVRHLISLMVKGGTDVVVGAPNATERMAITREGVFEVHMTEPDENGIQWNIPERSKRHDRQT